MRRPQVRVTSAKLFAGRTADPRTRDLRLQDPRGVVSARRPAVLAHRRSHAGVQDVGPCPLSADRNVRHVPVGSGRGDRSAPGSRCRRLVHLRRQATIVARVQRRRASRSVQRRYAGPADRTRDHLHRAKVRDVRGTGSGTGVAHRRQASRSSHTPAASIMRTADLADLRDLARRHEALDGDVQGLAIWSEHGWSTTHWCSRLAGTSTRPAPALEKLSRSTRPMAASCGGPRRDHVGVRSPAP